MLLVALFTATPPSIDQQASTAKPLRDRKPEYGMMEQEPSADYAISAGTI
jgi:hypothetical protein